MSWLSEKRKEELFLIFSVFVEIYRVFSGCLMVVFLPNMCGDRPCTPIQNLMLGDTANSFGYYTNFQAFLVMGILYGIEIRRENRLRKYLLFNTHNAVDSDSVGTALMNLSQERKGWLFTLHSRYRTFVYVSYAAYGINTVMSGYLVGRGFLDENSRIDERTVFSFFTGVLFLGAKLYDIYVIVSAEKNVFYSAYTKTYLQFNDVQEDKKRPVSMIEVVEKKLGPILMLRRIQGAAVAAAAIN
jgi:hypothetical protein